MRLYTSIDTPLGLMVLAAERAADGDSGMPALSMCAFVDQRYAAPVGPDWQRADDLLRPAADQLAHYFEGARTAFDTPLSLQGSEFQQRVWRGLLAIPYGSTWSYGELAAKVADRSKTRAVAAAVGRNPVGVIVPCHRVIGADGSLTGYAAGLPRKRWLLEHEATVAGRQPSLFPR
jgi:methylated-DNA-[protein]-cysteine S-methyltransferase